MDFISNETKRKKVVEASNSWIKIINLEIDRVGRRFRGKQTNDGDGEWRMENG